MSITITSPCVRRCTLDKDDICIGCHRSMAEILDWLNMDEDQRLAVMKRCRECKAS